MIDASMGPVQHDAPIRANPERPRVPEGRRVYAIGDIHGRDDLLARLHALIAEDAAAGAPAGNSLVYLGDYIDRGPASRQVIERLAGPPLAGFDAVFLKGNHDDFLLGFLDDGGPADMWLMNGGIATLASYGIEVGFPPGDPAVLDGIRRELARRLGPAHLEFLRRLKPSHGVGDYLFVHAGVRPGVALAEQDPFDLMWIRSGFLDWDGAFGAIVVHGHTIAPVPVFRANRIGIDTGAYSSGRLTCLVLEGDSRRLLQT
jgi:serine/threonine protein phosphatase 1